MHLTNELILGMGDFNGHVGWNIDGFEEVHGRFSIGERNQEQKMLLEFRQTNHIRNWNIGQVGEMSVNGYSDRRFKPRMHQYVVSLSKIINLHCFSRLSC